MDQKELILKISYLTDAITDFIDENGPEDIIDDIDEIQKVVVEAEEIRNQYRAYLKDAEQLLGEEFDELIGKPSVKILDKLKNHIKYLKQHKKNTYQTERAVKPNSIKTQFLIDEINRLSELLQKAWQQFIVSEETDDEIRRRSLELTQQTKGMKELTSHVKDLIETHDETNEELAHTVNNIHENYKMLQSCQSSYTELIKSLMISRELEKHETFKTSLLNIKLPKFNGYECSTDVYTFRSNFEKLYLKSTPTTLLPDLIKNNFLENPALLLVKNVTSMEEIWKRLIDSYGDRKTLLSKKLNDLQSIELNWRLKDHAKALESLTKIVNAMRDIMQLAEHHKIEDKLYFSDSINDIYKLLGESRLTRFLSSRSMEDGAVEGKEAWQKLIIFLEKESKVNQQKLLISRETNPQPKKNQNTPGKLGVHHSNQPTNQSTNDDTCFICGDKDHVKTNGPRGSQIVQYFACRKFVEMTPMQRLQTLRSKNLCSQCLYPGANQQSGKHNDGRCQRDFTCKHVSHNNYPNKRHVLVCDEHKTNQENSDLLEHYKSRCISKNHDLPDYSKKISVFHSETPKTHHSEDDERGIFMLQTIAIDGQNFTIFFDTGCSDFVCRHDAINKISARCNQLSSKPIKLAGVGGETTESNHGVFNVNLPLASGENASFTGVCLDRIATAFPQYPLKGQVEKDIIESVRNSGGNPQDLPQLPKFAGGQVDFMIGIKYLRYFPTHVHQTESGLTLYKSHFNNSDGSDGVIGGPHAVFTGIEQQHNLSTYDFVTNQFKSIQYVHEVNPDLKLRGYHDDQHEFDIIGDEATIGEETNQSQSCFLTRIQKFNNFEHVGSEITFRCVDCRRCSTCKQHSSDEMISIKEEVEQDVINRSIVVDVSNCTTIAKLPLMHDPVMKLEPNREIAVKVYNQQVKRLQKHEEDRKDIIKSEKKLQDLGYVNYVKNLSQEIQELLSRSPIQYYIPWRAVWKISSISTPCRIVFDASMATKSGFSLNDIVAKGRNNMNKLLEIFLRWRGHHVGLHTDIQKMYNSVKLHNSHWCLQRYLWQEDLQSNQPPEQKVIMTLIYGVKSSGNQAERGLRQTVTILKTEHPEVYEVIMQDVYVDDCLSGGKTVSKVKKLADDIAKIIARGGYTPKGFTISGQDPPPHLSSDGTSIAVAGMTWHPKEDLLSFDIKNLNFAKKYRGKTIGVINEIPKTLTRRICTSKSAEVFDMTGLLTPITATLKLALHDLVKRKLSWDDPLPDNLRNLWITHFEMISEIKNIRFKRAIVPTNATSLDIDTLDFGDASPSLICSTIYIRFPTSDGFSCQLIFSRSRLVPDDQSMPRAELSAAVLMTHTGEVVRKSFKKDHKAYRFTDSQIVLHWISNEDRPLKKWVRSRVIEIRRFTESSEWSYINSSNMMADLGTRPCSTINSITSDSPWINGQDWMRQPSTSFPTKTAKEICLSQAELQEVTKESHQSPEADNQQTSYITSTSIVPNQVSDRYAFSKYIIDPNKLRFSSVIRILAIVIKFIRNLKHFASNPRTYKIYIAKLKFKPSSALSIPENLLKESEDYFFKKGSQEVKQFVQHSKYVNISTERNEILLYNGRILPTDSITIVGKATQAMSDLTSKMFCVPILERHSPISYAIINEIHWHHPTVSHSGVETTWRYLLQKTYIIEGRKLVKAIRSTCERCRYLTKNTLEVTMGPLSPHNLMIAPAFYATQVDLCGPFQSFSYHNKRATVKIWFAVFCCSTTTTTCIKVMEDYSTSAFLQSFTRFSCEVGYPKQMISDEGSQLVKGCGSMKLDVKDIQWRLFTDVHVEFETCPVGGHNMNGRVERKIKEIKSSISKSTSNLRLSIMQWETFAARAANCINDLPLAIRDIKGDFEASDLITPNRLRLGRNNNRSPAGRFSVVNNPEKIINQNQKIFDSWFELWLTCHVPSLMPRPKWFKSDADVNTGDVVLFTKNESPILSTYQFGIIVAIERGRDGHIRKVHVRYHNSSEKSNRVTFRSVRSLVIIHRASETNINQELFEAGRRSRNL